jgi:hypothetical protein
MKTASTYIAKTESAVRQLFSGVDNYLQILKRSKLPIFTPTFSRWRPLKWCNSPGTPTPV